MTIAHRVAPWETWQSIARDFYGDARRAGDLASRNGAEVGRIRMGGGAVDATTLALRDLRVVHRRGEVLPVNPAHLS